MDDLWIPWPPRSRWTAYELTCAYDCADDGVTFLTTLSGREWELVQRAALDAPDAQGERPAQFTMELAREMVAVVSYSGGRPS